MKRTLFALAVLSLAACTQGNNDRDFLCDAQDGQPCRTMAEVDGKVTRSASPKVHTASTPKTTTQAFASGSAHRLPERTGRMWVAPYHSGQYIHEGSTVRFVVRNGRWAQ